ncbi:MAG: M48 family metallopeptidase [Eubacterium sp.]|nr:M48 family metallopeptidase [Eubacterium sp.]
MESIEFKGRKIEYSLIRKNVKNINLRVKRDGAVVVSASPLVPKVVINKFVAENGDKILSSIDKMNARNSALSLEEGSIVKLLGKSYNLILEESTENSYFIGEDDITFYLTDINNSEIKQNVYHSLLANTAKVLFPKLIEECYPPFKTVCNAVPSLKIKDLKSQWGNCYHKRNLITLNLRLVVYDLNVIKSVVYHEYCHFVHQNHSKDFYNLLFSVCPSWKECDKILKNKK